MVLWFGYRLSPRSLSTGSLSSCVVNGSKMVVPLRCTFKPWGQLRGNKVMWVWSFEKIKALLLGSGAPPREIAMNTAILAPLMFPISSLPTASLPLSNTLAWWCDPPGDPSLIYADHVPYSTTSGVVGRRKHFSISFMQLWLANVVSMGMGYGNPQ